MRLTVALLGAVALAGCLSPAPKAPVSWTVSIAGAKGAAVMERKWDVVRVSRVEVRAPYDGRSLAVLRPDGSLAFDSFNAFAATPASILVGAAVDALSASGAAASVIGPHSIASAQMSMEVTVTRLALDCRKDGARDASVALSIALLDGRRLVSVAEAEGGAATPDGNYSAAFSSAFGKAFAEALKRL